MPGRGQPWKLGKGVADRIGTKAIADGSITEADLDSALTNKVNSSGHEILEEGGSLPQRGRLDFVGAGVVASDGVEDTTTVTIAGGGSGGGLMYSSFVMDSLGDYTPFGPSEASFVSGENNNLDGAIMRAGKVTKIWVTVKSAQAGSTTLDFRKNNANSGTQLTWNNTANGTVVKNTEDRTFVVDDELSFRVAGTPSFLATVVVEWDFS